MYLGQQVQHVLDSVNSDIPVTVDPSTHQTLPSEKQPSFHLEQQHHPHPNTHFHSNFNSQNQPHPLYQSSNSPRYHNPTQPINQLNQSINSMDIHVTYKPTSNVDILRYI